ncbi:hypothetical protein GCM10023205_70580 [Yinghuangia aomiensis]|uniref:Uncharacterized protein n=1 Tax=Yinghuangia aomiensis TaxID=676205 RepID=A0ABP9I7A2_9ACTN
MHRTFQRAAVLLTAVGAACFPGIAVADAPAPPPSTVVVVGNNNQLAGQNVFNAGHDNTVGSIGAGGPGTGVGGTPAPTFTAVIQNDSRATLTLTRHTGDANFPGTIFGLLRDTVTFSERSTADYQSNDGRSMSITLDVNSAGQETVSCNGDCHIDQGNTIVFD